MTLLTLLLTAGPIYAVTLADTVADFSGTQGANGFTYGYYTTPADPGTFSTAGMNFGSNVWQGPFNGLPHHRDASQHPANGPSAVRRYTASELTGPTLADLVGTYNDIDTGGGNSQTVRIFLDGVQLLSDDLSDDGNTVKNYSFQILLTPASIIDFEADPNANVFFDTTGLTGRITIVPEPGSSMALLLLSSGLLVWRSRFRTSIG